MVAMYAHLFLQKIRNHLYILHERVELSQWFYYDDNTVNIGFAAAAASVNVVVVLLLLLLTIIIIVSDKKVKFVLYMLI